MHCPLIVITPKQEGDTPAVVFDRVRAILQEDLDDADKGSIEGFLFMCNEKDCDQYQSCEQRDASCNSIAEEIWWRIGGRWSGLFTVKPETLMLAPRFDLPQYMIIPNMNPSRIIPSGNLRIAPDGHFEDDCQTFTKELYETYVQGGIEMWSEEDSNIGFEKGDVPRTWFAFDHPYNFDMSTMFGKASAVIIDYRREY